MAQIATSGPHRPSKWFLLSCAAIVLAPVVLGHTKALVYSAYYRAQKIALIFEGEDPVDSNFYHAVGVVSKNRRFFGERSLELASPIAVDGGYFSRYEIAVPRDGDYDIFVAGTPPGPIGRGSKWYSPYSVSVDDGPPILLTEAELKKVWPQLHKLSYAPGGYYFTKILTQRLSEGRHTLTFRVNDRRSHDGRFAFYLDALIVVPSEFEPKSRVGRLPRALFDD